MSDLFIIKQKAQSKKLLEHSRSLFREALLAA